MTLFKTLIAATMLSLPAAGLAHDFWLAPADFQMAAPGPIKIAFRIGDEANPESWNLQPENVVALRSHGPDGIRDQQATIQPHSESEPGYATVQLPTAGTQMIAFESNQSLSDLPAAEFNPYLKHEGLAAVIAERERTGTTAKNGTETYARRAKALIQVGAQPTDQIMQPIGHTLEVVPEKNPYALGPDGVLPVTILFRGKPLAGATVSLIDMGGKGVPLSDQITGADGRARFTVPQRSNWRLNVVWSVPSPASKRAAFDTIFASLSFGYGQGGS